MALTKNTAHRKDLSAGIGPMEHRHFATIATIIRGMGEGVAQDMVAHLFADSLGATNSKFDKRRFLLACGVEA